LSLKRALPAAVAFLVFFLAGSVVSVMAGTDDFDPAGPSEATYALTDVRVVYPLADHGDGWAGVDYAVSWPDATFPGRAVCRFEVWDESGNLLGRADSDLVSLTPLVERSAPFPVPVAEGTPSSATVRCAEADRPGTYSIDEVAVVDTDGGLRITAHVGWPEGKPVGVNACVATLTSTSGDAMEWHFTLSAPEGNLVIASLPGRFADATAPRVDCQPYEAPRDG
jgi:hypothetical protein